MISARRRQEREREKKLTQELKQSRLQFCLKIEKKKGTSASFIAIKEMRQGSQKKQKLKSNVQYC